MTRLHGIARGCLDEAAHRWAVAGTIHRDGVRQVGCCGLQGLPGIGRHKLAQLARFAERKRLQTVLDALRLQDENSGTERPAGRSLRAACIIRQGGGTSLILAQEFLNNQCKGARYWTED